MGISVSSTQTLEKLIAKRQERRHNSSLDQKRLKRNRKQPPNFLQNPQVKLTQIIKQSNSINNQRTLQRKMNKQQKSIQQNFYQIKLKMQKTITTSGQDEHLNTAYARQNEAMILRDSNNNLQNFIFNNINNVNTKTKYGKKIPTQSNSINLQRKQYSSSNDHPLIVIKEKDQMQSNEKYFIENNQNSQLQILEMKKQKSYDKVSKDLQNIQRKKKDILAGYFDEKNASPKRLSNNAYVKPYGNSSSTLMKNNMNSLQIIRAQIQQTPQSLSLNPRIQQIKIRKQVQKIQKLESDPLHTVGRYKPYGFNMNNSNENKRQKVVTSPGQNHSFQKTDKYRNDGQHSINNGLRGNNKVNSKAGIRAGINSRSIGNMSPSQRIYA